MNFHGHPEKYICSLSVLRNVYNCTVVHNGLTYICPSTLLHMLTMTQVSASPSNVRPWGLCVALLTIQESLTQEIPTTQPTELVWV